MRVRLGPLPHGAGRLGALAGLVVMLAVAAACGGDEPRTAIARSDRDRELSPGVATEDHRAQVAGNSAFALDLYRELAAGEGNLFFSPHSISVALAMTYAGARGETAAEMAEALRFALPPERLHAFFNALDLSLAQRPRVDLADEDAQPPELSVANSAWGDLRWEFLPGFLDVLAVNYDAGMRLADFREEPEAARLAVNAWVEEETRDRIRDLLPAGSITPATALVLANAIYFRAGWATPFESNRTAPATFTLRDGTVVDVPTMHGAVPARFAEVPGAAAVELPYAGGEVSMILVVPDAGTFPDAERAFDAGFLEELDRAWGEATVDLAIPRFTFESTFRLNDVLSRMGMASAFSAGAADFSGMDGSRSLFLTAVVHKAFVAVDEKGTEAAAATAVIAGGGSPDGRERLVVDRPFLFMIRDVPTGAILFVGRVVDPR